ncbi:hypothetical protein IKE87_02285 [Candidatus Saccharibacteria bacterium]|nr:hypothetical protein [Candidatus Saccharibacteria bacterium]
MKNSKTNSKVSSKMSRMKGNTDNRIVITMLGVLIAIVLCVGGYFVIKDMNKNNSNNGGTSQTTGGGGNSGQAQGGSSSDSSGSNTPAPAPAPEELEAGITFAEVRSNNYHVEAQVNGQVNGNCDITVVPTSGGEGPHETDDLEISNKVSICSEDFSLKGMNPGEHKVTVVITATDGRTKTLEQIVNI